ncbi:MAG: Mov34/MPN/PAD-1 family protein [Candidatus Methanoplasma sp.]|jgi:proteasome lid subunit RPN8/RPN11|nr:Mov34/MPN/PAD-1 family protein [Candidatus Methanoplasma sp.]
MPKVISARGPERKHRPRAVKGVRLFAAETAVREMIFHADAGAAVRKEVMGLMMGAAYCDDEGEYAVVTGTATSELDADEVSVRFDRGCMEELFGSMDSACGDEVVGWYHSHPGFGCYLSDTDIRTHEGIFGNDAGFALVIDPDAGTFAVFVCNDGAPETVRMVVME